MAKIGYARVSTAEQNEARQIAALEQQGVEKLFIDKLSGKNKERPQLTAMLEYVREGDVLIVTELARLARSTKNMLEIVEELQRKKVRLVSLRESFDTSTPYGQFTLTIFAAMAQLERDNIRASQREGIELAKKEGRYKGRAEKPYSAKRFCAECEKWVRGNQTATATMRIMQMTPNRFYRLARRHGYFVDGVKVLP